jgi:hypothetical protein
VIFQYDRGNRAVYVDPISSVFNAYTNESWWQAQLSETHTFGPTAANQFLLAGTYINQGAGVANSSQALAAFPTTLNWFNGSTTFALLGGFDYLYAWPSGSKTTSYQISDDLVKAQGKHYGGRVLMTGGRDETVQNGKVNYTVLSSAEAYK